MEQRAVGKGLRLTSSTIPHGAQQFGRNGRGGDHKSVNARHVLLRERRQHHNLISPQIHRVHDAQSHRGAHRQARQQFGTLWGSRNRHVQRPLRRVRCVLRIHWRFRFRNERRIDRQPHNRSGKSQIIIRRRAIAEIALHLIDRIDITRQRKQPIAHRASMILHEVLNEPLRPQILRIPLLHPFVLRVERQQTRSLQRCNRTRLQLVRQLNLRSIPRRSATNTTCEHVIACFVALRISAPTPLIHPHVLITNGYSTSHALADPTRKRRGVSLHQELHALHVRRRLVFGRFFPEIHRATSQTRSVSNLNKWRLMWHTVDPRK